MNRTVNRAGVPPRPRLAARDGRPTTSWLPRWGGPLCPPPLVAQDSSLSARTGKMPVPPNSFYDRKISRIHESVMYGRVCLAQR